MKHKLTFCSLLLLLTAYPAAAMNSANDKVLEETTRPSALRRHKLVVSFDRLPYQNILDASKWSRMKNGRALALSLRKKNAHASQEPDYFCVDCDLLFSTKTEDPMVQPIYGSTSGAYGGCDWKCCFRTCMETAMAGTGTMCLTNCTACGVLGGAWSCSICVSCGTVGFVAIEFCGLHCCVNPGCPAG